LAERKEELTKDKE